MQVPKELWGTIDHSFSPAECEEEITVSDDKSSNNI